jgi:hypothetical protein
MDDFATTFGITMGQLVTEYRNLFAWLAAQPPCLCWQFPF